MRTTGFRVVICSELLEYLVNARFRVDEGCQCRQCPIQGIWGRDPSCKVDFVEDNNNIKDEMGLVMP